MQCQDCMKEIDEAEFNFETFNCNECQEKINEEDMEDVKETTIVQYDEFKTKMEEIEKASNFLPSKETYTESKRVALDIGKVITKLDKMRKEFKQPHLDAGAKVDDEARKIREALENHQKPHKELYKQIDKETKEANANLEGELQCFINLPLAMANFQSEALKLSIGRLEEIDQKIYKSIKGSGQVFLDVIGNMKELLKKAIEREAKEAQAAKDAEEVKKLKAANEKLEKEAADAKFKIEDAERLRRAQEEQAAHDKQREADRIERVEKQRIADEEWAAENAKAQEIAKQAAVDKALEIEKSKVAHAAAIAKQEEDARAADKANVSKCRNEVYDAIFNIVGGELAVKVTDAIIAGDIPRVSIGY